MGRKKRTVALVLGSGGARGLAHIGIIEELLNRGYEITSVSGTSMGALVGGIYAAGKLEDFKHWIEGVDKFKMFQLHIPFRRLGKRFPHYQYPERVGS